LDYEPQFNHGIDEAAAGVSTVELCPDNHENKPRDSSKQKYQGEDDQDSEDRENEATAGFSTMDYWRWPYERGYSHNLPPHQQHVGDLLHGSDQPVDIIGYQGKRLGLAEDAAVMGNAQFNQR